MTPDIDKVFATHGWAVALLVMILVGISAFITLYFTRIIIPRNAREEKLADARNAREQALAEEAQKVLQNVAAVTNSQLEVSRAIRDDVKELHGESKRQIVVLDKLVEQHENPGPDNKFQTVTTNAMLQQQLEVVRAIHETVLIQRRCMKTIISAMRSRIIANGEVQIEEIAKVADDLERVVQPHHPHGG